MEIKPDQLDAWARFAADVNRALIQGSVSIMQIDTKAISELFGAQRANNLLLQELKRAGARDPIPRRRHTDSGNPEVPLELLSSPKARRYAEAIHLAAVACREMEEERDIEDGLADQLESFAATAHLEVFGPIGLDR